LYIPGIPIADTVEWLPQDIEKNKGLMRYRLVQAHLKAAFNNRSIVRGDQLKSHAADYVKNKMPPKMSSEPQTIINSLHLSAVVKENGFCIVLDLI